MSSGVSDTQTKQAQQEEPHEKAQEILNEPSNQQSSKSSPEAGAGNSGNELSDQPGGLAVGGCNGSLSSKKDEVPLDQLADKVTGNASQRPPQKVGDAEVVVQALDAREHGCIKGAGRVPEKCTMTLVLHIPAGLPVNGEPMVGSAAEGERLVTTIARRLPVKGSDYAVSCRAVEREHGPHLSKDMRAALRAATRLQQEWRPTSQPACDLHVRIVCTVDGAAPKEAVQQSAALTAAVAGAGSAGGKAGEGGKEGAQGHAAQQTSGDGAGKDGTEGNKEGGAAAHPPGMTASGLPLNVELIDPQAGGVVTVKAQQMRANGMLKIASSYHAPNEIKNVPMLMFLDGPPGCVPSGRVQVGETVHVDLVKVPDTEVYSVAMGKLLRGPLAKEWPDASELEKRALLEWHVQDVRWNKGTRTFWVKLSPTKAQMEEVEKKKSVGPEEATEANEEPRADETSGSKRQREGIEEEGEPPSKQINTE